MYERFTDRARKVMQLANQEAQRFNHEYIGTEHILLGLVKEGSGAAANVLKNLDIDLREIRLEVEKIVQSGAALPSWAARMPETPRAKKVVEYAIDDARNLKANYVGTEHLLLGLLREQEGVAAQVLMYLGVKLEDVREEVHKVLGISASDRQEAIRQAELVRSQKPPPPVEWLARFPNEAKRALTAIDAHIEKLIREKESAVAEQDFEKAAYLVDKVNKLKRQVLEAIKTLQGVVGESEANDG